MAAQEKPQERVRVSGPERNEDGFLEFHVECPWQERPTTVEVLPPDEMDAEGAYPVLWLLPVNPCTRGRWGDALVEARRLDLANRRRLICVSPSFSRTPWFADHPTDEAVAQETYLLEAVLPLIEERFPAGKRPEDRLLVGFSKSGVGAWSLLLRHPDVFGFAASWDAPMTLPQPDRWGMEEVYGTQEHYERHFIPALLRKRVDELKDRPARLVLLGHGTFEEPVRAVHEQLEGLGVPHVYANEPKRAHNWKSGWLPEAVEHLMRLREGALEAREQ